MADIAARRWRAWGFLIGGRLPNGQRKIGGATIVHLRDDPRLPETRSLPRKLACLTGLAYGWSALPARLFVASDWVAEWMYEAPDHPAASAFATEKLIPDLLAALNTSDGGPYYFDPMLINEVSPQGTFGNPYTFFPPDSSLGPLEVRSMSEEEVAIIQRRHDQLLSDPVAVKASAFYRQGVEVSPMWASHQTFGYAPLIAFHLCIETLVEALGTSDGTRDARTNAEASIVQRLLEELGDTAKPHADRVVAVRRGASELDNIAHAPFRQRLAKMVERLQLTEDDLTRLLAFYRFRNDHLGHPNKMLVTAGVETWVKEGRDLARRVLAAYLDTAASVGPALTFPNGDRLSREPVSGPQVHFTDLKF